MMDDKERIKKQILEKIEKTPSLEDIPEERIVTIAQRYKKTKEDVPFLDKKVKAVPDTFEFSLLLENTLKDLDLTELENIYNIPIFAFATWRLLSKREQAYYIRKWVEYHNEYNFSKSDRAQLHALIMEEIIFNKLYEAQLASNKDLSKQLTESIKRHDILVQSLGMSRKQRMSKKGDGVDIASMISEFDQERRKETQERLLKMEEEEEELLRKKIKEIELEMEENG